MMSEEGGPFNDEQKKMLEQIRTVMWAALGPTGAMMADHEEDQAEVDKTAAEVGKCNDVLLKKMTGDGIVAKEKKSAEDADEAFKACSAKEKTLLAARDDERKALEKAVAA